MSLLISRVFGDKVEVFPADDEGAVHLCGNDSTGEDTSSNRDFASKGAFLVCIADISL